MRTALMIMFLCVSALAQMDYEKFVQRVKTTTDRHALQAEIRDQGVAFSVDLKRLKRMKSDGLPDWAIDTLVLMNEDHDAYDEDLYYRNHYQPLGYWSGYWNPWFAMGYGYFAPWNVWNYPYWYSDWYWGVTTGYGVPGNRVSPRGYVNRHEPRYRGRAVRRDHSHSSSGDHASSRSSSGSSRGSVTRSGYHKD